MSTEAMCYVFRHSPYKGAAFALHLAIADSANEQNDNEVWLSLPKLGVKARQSRRSVINVIATLLRDEFLELVDSQHGPTRSTTYKMLFPTVPVVYDSPEGRRTGARRAPVQSATGADDDTNGCKKRHQPVQTLHSSLLIRTQLTQENPKFRASSKKPNIGDRNIATIARAVKAVNGGES